MKIYKIIFFGLIFIFSCSNNVENRIKYGDFENDWERDNMFGKVKSIEQYKANVIDFESEKTEEPIIVFKKKYTDFGKISYQENYDNLGELIQLLKNEYNDKKQRVKSNFENLVIPSKSIETAEFNEKGEQIYAHVVFDDTLKFKAILEYDEYSNLISQENIQNGDTTSESYEYKYDNNGKILWKKQIEKSENGINQSFNDFKYDQNGNLIEVLFESEYFGKMKSTYEYDNNNRIEKITEYQSGQIEKETLFDENYNQILIKFYKRGELNKEMKSEYDFDSKGNWIERKVFVKEFPDNAKNMC